MEEKSPFLSFLGATKTKPYSFWTKKVWPDWCHSYPHSGVDVCCHDVVFSLNGYLQETKAAIEDPKLITSTASSTGPGMNGPPKLFNKRPSQLNVNVPGGFHTLQDFAPFG